MSSQDQRSLLGDVRSDERGSNFSDSPYWNISLLAIAWALTLSTSTLLTAVGPLSAKDLGASNSLAAFTVGAFLIGAALSSVPSGWLFRKYGRFVGFTLGCAFQLIGSALGTIAIYSRQLVWLYFGCLSIGLAQGLGQFYRFSAVEISPPEFKSSAITYVLSGGVIAAFLGPTAATYTVSLIGRDFIGSYLIVAAFAGLNFLDLYLVRFPPPINPYDQKVSQNSELSFVNVEVRSTKEIITTPLFILSCTIATLAHTIMIMIMSNVSIDMINNGYSFRISSLVLELHFVAMFGPGFFTGKLIERYGSFSVALIGGFIFAGSSVLLALGTAEWNYIAGMILVGVAWNFSFSAGTVMLTSSYKVHSML
jgi:MFS family permease